MSKRLHGQQAIAPAKIIDKGAWADEGEELDEFLDEMRRLRRMPCRDLGECPLI